MGVAADWHETETDASGRYGFGRWSGRMTKRRRAAAVQDAGARERNSETLIARL